MIALLFDKTFWISILICATIAGLVILFALKPKSRPYIISGLCLVLMITSAISIVNLNRYYSAQGGIRGLLSSAINGENKGEARDNTVSLNNIMLTLDEEGNYSAKIIPQGNITIDAEKTYSVNVNGLPCSYTEVYPDYVLAYYEYNFYDKNQDFKTDTLEIYFSIDNQTSVEVLTRGGSEMVKYWNYYFNKNDFTITIEEVQENFSYKEPTSSTMTNEEVVNQIIQKNNLSLIKNVTFEDDDGPYGISYQSRTDVASLSEIIDLTTEEDLHVITNTDSVKVWNCIGIDKEEYQGKYKDLSSSVVKIITFTYYEYNLSFRCDDESLSIRINYNPEFDANEWEPYNSAATVTPASLSGGNPCNYIKACQDFPATYPPTVYLVQGSIK